jgi:lipopolysaccharide transport system permease protein
LGYVVYVLSGLIPWIALQDALSRGPASITGSANLVKQIVFPSEVLPLKVSLAALTTLAVGLPLTVILACFDGRSSIAGISILLPAAIMMHLALSAGLVYAFSAIGVFLKDLKEIVAFILSIGLFLHPILYVPGQVPSWLAHLFTFSPFSHIIWCFRDALVEGRLTRPLSWLVSGLTAVACFAIGWRVFRMLKPTFGNAL